MSASSVAPHEFWRLCRLNAGRQTSLVTIPSPSPIDQLRSYFADRFKPSASPRMGHQAMIVSPVRIQHLIALIARSSSHALHREGLQAGSDGLFEEEPRALDKSTRGWRGSARKRPQVYGQFPALLFDVAGLVDWLRSQFPRSTPHNVEARTGIAAASVENWLHRRSQPSVEHFTLLIAVFGPALLQACLRQPPGWVEQAARQERKREIDEQIARLMMERDGSSASLGMGEAQA
ncbi:hypothetical protein J2T08_003630 [Neorhizobium galegae]|uniref:hypothetical protein n=1 Tax=Neorhizobium galegae TaxID=399 RepID=UPI00277D9531|nr:hypothetical protein [Neorhizobium galegae]MDQ0135709.1 hypothetical protein [Neorhizobium galegae]